MPRDEHSFFRKWHPNGGVDLGDLFFRTCSLFFFFLIAAPMEMDMGPSYDGTEMVDGWAERW